MDKERVGRAANGPADTHQAVFNRRREQRGGLATRSEYEQVRQQEREGRVWGAHLASQVACRVALVRLEPDNIFAAAVAPPAQQFAALLEADPVARGPVS